MEFQHTAARRRLDRKCFDGYFIRCFNTQPPEGGWEDSSSTFATDIVSTHSRPKAAGFFKSMGQTFIQVSTHSRPKAAGICAWIPYICFCCFNTQPPEGGWRYAKAVLSALELFQHTAARRRLARRKPSQTTDRSFNTQPPEGGWLLQKINLRPKTVSTHSRPKAAGKEEQRRRDEAEVSTHSRPKAAGQWRWRKQWRWWFQHTAARRRLAQINNDGEIQIRFQHTAARRRLGCRYHQKNGKKWFQHTAARRRLVDC